MFACFIATVTATCWECPANIFEPKHCQETEPLLGCDKFIDFVCVSPPNADSACEAIGTPCGLNGGHGNITGDGTCKCLPGSNGTFCGLSRANCSMHGDPTMDDACVCDANANGPRCEFTRSGTCSGFGSPSMNGSCLCDVHTAGARCQYSRNETCTSHGDPVLNGSCLCDVHTAGPRCQYSRNETCASHGDPVDNGQCQCDHGYLGTVGPAAVTP